MFDILKNLLGDGKKENNYNEENTNQIDNKIQKAEKSIVPEVNKAFTMSSDDIDKAKAKVNQYQPLNEDVTEYTRILPMNQELFNLMKDQLKEKDLQIHELNEILNQAQYLHKNTQILSKLQQPEQDLVPLEDDIDENFNKVKINTTDHKEQKHKGFFGILFEK